MEKMKVASPKRSICIPWYNLVSKVSERSDGWLWIFSSALISQGAQVSMDEVPPKRDKIKTAILIIREETDSEIPIVKIKQAFWFMFRPKGWIG